MWIVDYKKKTKKLLIVEQLLLVSIIEYVPRTVLRIYILMSGCNKKLFLLLQEICDFFKHTRYDSIFRQELVLLAVF